MLASFHPDTSFHFIIEISCPSVNENEAPMKNLHFFTGGVVL